MTDILTVDHLQKNFGQLEAVSQLSFEVREGEILGVMGPNGAGKTTVFNLLTGILKPEMNLWSSALEVYLTGFMRLDSKVSR